MDEKKIENAISQLWDMVNAAPNPTEKALTMGMALIKKLLGPECEVYAVDFFRFAAEREDPMAMYNLGMCYRWGEGGVFVDADEAMVWFEKAAEKGHEKAADLCADYNNPKGKAIILMSAISGAGGQGSKWYKSKAMVEQYYSQANSGDGEAQYELARQLENPERLGPFRYNIQEAIHWYTQSANSGVVDAMFNLALIHETGKLGAPVDKQQALHWYRKAAERGDEEAKTRAQALETQI